MAIGIGIPTTFGFAKEIVYGTPVAAVSWSEILSEGLAIDREPIVKPSLRRVSESETFQGVKIVGGPVGMNVMFEGQLKLWEQLFGSVLTSGAGPDFTHVFTLADILPIGLTLELGRTLETFRYHGAKIVQAEITIEPDGLLTVVWTFACEDEEKFVTAAAVFPTELLIPFHFGNTLTVGGVTMEFDSLSFIIANTLKTDRFKQGSELTKEPVRDGLRVITGEFTKDYETSDIADIYDKFTGHTDAPGVFEYVGGVIGGGNFTWKLELPRLKLGGVTPVAEGPGIRTLTVPFRAIFDEAGAADAAKLTIINGESAV